MTSEALKPVARIDCAAAGGFVWERGFGWADQERLHGEKLYLRPSPELVREIAEKYADYLCACHEIRGDGFIHARRQFESAINEALGHEGVKG